MLIARRSTFIYSSFLMRKVASIEEKMALDIFALNVQKCNSRL